ncbi:hypothetical protein C8R46DRAFT_446581 [Mycena filopes]|nr:hypothetical protein C8R46DRAFT_446581 [Mycena filopes]
MARIVVHLLLTLAMLSSRYAVNAVDTITLPAPNIPNDFGALTETGAVLGVDSQGRTTYGIENVKGSIYATRVQGSDHVFITLSQTGVDTELSTTTRFLTAIEGYDCDLEKDGGAVCSGVDVSNSRFGTTTMPPQSVGTLVLAVVSTAPGVGPAAPSSTNSASALSGLGWSLVLGGVTVGAFRVLA